MKSENRTPIARLFLIAVLIVPFGKAHSQKCNIAKVEIPMLNMQRYGKIGSSYDSMKTKKGGTLEIMLFNMYSFSNSREAFFISID